MKFSDSLLTALLLSALTLTGCGDSDSDSGSDDNDNSETPIDSNSHSAAITDTDGGEGGDTGELRLLLDEAQSTGQVSVSIKYPANETETAYLTLFGSSTSTSDAIADLKMDSGYATTDGGVGIRLRDDDSADDVTITDYTAGEWTNISVSWSAADEEFTIAINGSEIGTYSMYNTGSVEKIALKLSSSSGTSDYTLYIDDLTVYSDSDASTEIFSDNYDDIAAGTSLVGYGDYSSSSFSVVVSDADDATDLDLIVDDGSGNEPDDDPDTDEELDTSAYEKPTSYDAIATSISGLESELDAASSGDVIALANGTYTDVDLDIETDGVILVAETSGSVFIEGTSTIELSGDNIIFEGFTFQNGQPDNTKGAIIISGNYNRVTNCKIDHFNDDEADNSYKWISLDNDATYGEVDHCTFTGKETEGALLVVWRDSDDAQYHHIYRNIFSDHQYVEEEDIDDDNNGWEAIRIGTSTYSQSSSYTTVEYNYFYDCNGEIEIISNKSGHNVYRYNTFESSSGLLTLRHGNSCTVDSNYFLVDNTSGGGIRVIDKDHTITNNYIEGAYSTSNSRGGICLSSHQTDPEVNGYWEVSDVTVANNTIINSKQSLHYGSSAKDNAPTSATISNNLIRNNIDDDGDYDFVRVTENSSGESLNIVDPTYSNNYFYGSSDLGFSPVPDGISLTEVALSQNNNGQYYATDTSLNLGAPELEKLDFDSDVGCDF